MRFSSSVASLCLAAFVSAGAQEGTPDARTFTMPRLGPAAKSVVLSPDRRTTEASLDSAAYRVLIPECSQTEPGVFICTSILEYQHCRTLMVGRMIYSCRVGLAFDGGFASPRAAAAGEYSLEIDSDARVRVTRGDRGFGQIRGEADVELRIEPPLDGPEARCLQRDPYLYHPTGPDGGMSELGEPAIDCEEPIEFSFEPHADDLLRAYDLCETFAAWGQQIEDSIALLAAGLFQIRSASSGIAPESAVIAPYVRVEAPLEIDCRQ